MLRGARIHECVIERIQNETEVYAYWSGASTECESKQFKGKVFILI